MILTDYALFSSAKIDTTKTRKHLVARLIRWFKSGARFELWTRPVLDFEFLLSF